MKHGTVFVSEDVDDDYCAGVWSAHWQAGDEFHVGPQGVSAMEAIAWGRERADVVLVVRADSDVHHSAGMRRPAREGSSEFPPWPEGHELPRRRAAGLDYLDRAHETEPILWRVEGAGGLYLTGGGTLFIKAFASALAADDNVADILVAPRIDVHGLCEYQLAVRASTCDEAEEIALDAIGRAAEVAVAELSTRANVLNDRGMSGWTRGSAERLRYDLRTHDAATAASGSGQGSRAGASAKCA